MISDRITKTVKTCHIRVNYPPDDLMTYLSQMPDLACQRVGGSLDRTRGMIARALIMRGLFALDQIDLDHEEICYVWREAKLLTVPSWVDEWIYEIADREGRSMSEIAQAALELGRAQVLPSP